jgi:hypothetical protein
MLFVAGIALAASARAETKTSGRISAGVGFKPQFVESDGDGKYGLVTGKVSAAVDDAWAISLEESLKAVEEPEKEAAFEDPVLRVSSLVNPLEGTGLKLGASLSAVLGLSLDSRDADYYGALRPTLALSKELGPVEVGVGTSYTHHIQKYTRSPKGKSTLESNRSASFFAGADLGAGFSLALSLAYVERVPHDGPHKYGYLNEIGLEYQATDVLSFEVGLSTSDSQLAADGSDINEFSFYRQNKTEMYVGASHAL